MQPTAAIPTRSLQCCSGSTPCCSAPPSTLAKYYAALPESLYRPLYAQSASVILHDEGTQEVELTTTYGPPPAFHTLRYPLAGVPHRLGSAAPAPSPRRAPHAGRVAPGVAAGGTTQTSACAPRGLARPLVDPGASHREPRSRVGGRV